MISPPYAPGTPLGWNYSGVPGLEPFFLDDTIRRMFVTPEEARSFLQFQTVLHVQPGLARVQAALALLGEPQQCYKALHVAGTNGKTSVTTIIAALLEAHGLLSGHYLSPHLTEIEERIVVGGVPILPAAFADHLEYLLPVFDEAAQRTGGRLSEFEVCTVLAFSWFAACAVEVAVVETGLGGTFDATNVLGAPVCVLTNVAVDHVAYLGSDLSGICREKMGIVTPDAQLVTGVTDPDLLLLLEAHCAASGASGLWRLGTEIQISRSRVALGGVLFDLSTPYGVYEELFLGLLGVHQAQNAALAIAAVECFFGRALDQDVVRSCLDTVKVPGRMEIACHQPLVLLDGAHNPAGAAALATALDEFFPDRSLFLVCGALDDKDVWGILAPLVERAEIVVATAPQTSRARPAHLLARDAERLGATVLCENSVTQAVQVAVQRATERDLVLVTGSLRTVGEARQALATIVTGALV